MLENTKKNTGVPVKLPAVYWLPPLRLTQYVDSPSMRVCTRTKAKSSLVQLFHSERPVNLWSLRSLDRKSVV